MKTTAFRKLGIEPLESRQLLTVATLDSGSLTVADTANNANVINVGRTGNNLVITDSNVQFDAAPTGGSLSNGNKTLTIPFSLVTKSLNLNPGAGDDKITIDDHCLIPASFSDGINIDGGAGSHDTLRILNHQTSNVWNITGAYSGDVTVESQATIRFSNLENAFGGTGNDLYKIANLTQILTGNLYMNLNYFSGGIDTLDFESDAKFISLSDGVVGAASSGSYQTFYFPNSSIKSASLTGGPSGNVINATGFNGPVHINGGDGNDTLIGAGFNDILDGGAGDDFIDGAGGDDTLLGGTGRDILIGGMGADILNSGSTDADKGDDLLIGGTLNIPDYVNSKSNVAYSLIGSWAQPATYLGHINQLSNIGVGPQHKYKLNASTVLDDNTIDILIGGTGNDWFFAGTSGQNKDTTDQAGFEQVVGI